MSDARYDYRIDSKDRLVWVAPDWLAFARENGAPALTREVVIEKPLWDFIAGKEAARLYSLLFSKVREEQESVTVPFRCDSPNVRRFMRLTISPLSDAGIELNGALLREEHRRYVTLLDSSTPRSDTLIVVCSWCKNVLVLETEWVEAERVSERLLAEPEGLPALTHGVCPACEGSIEAYL